MFVKPLQYLHSFNLPNTYRFDSKQSKLKPTIVWPVLDICREVDFTYNSGAPTRAAPGKARPRASSCGGGSVREVTSSAGPAGGGIRAQEIRRAALRKTLQDQFSSPAPFPSQSERERENKFRALVFAPPPQGYRAETHTLEPPLGQEHESEGPTDVFACVYVKTVPALSQHMCEC